MSQGVFIGIGGIGSSIVTHIQRELKLRVDTAGNTPAAEDAANKYQFLLVDTWHDKNAQFFEQHQVFVIPIDDNRFAADPLTHAYMERDPFFKTWWPKDDDGDPHLVGNFGSGAGQFRIKGKLAYRISLTEVQGGAIANQVNAAVDNIQKLLGSAGPLSVIPVYLVSSLGGGTGSGITLALAQHLRYVLPGNCELIGAFPLASVTKLRSAPNRAVNIQANTDAALREIDYCQRAKLDPFLDWGQAGHIPGSVAPFKYSYLFGRDNAKGKNLSTPDQYEKLIAECLVAESMSDLRTKGGLTTEVQGPHDNFITVLNMNKTIDRRSAGYASAAVVSLVYPVERIEQHLGRKFTIAVLDRMLATPAERRVTGHVEAVITQEKLAWQGNPPFVDRLTEPVEREDQIVRLGAFPRLQKVDEESYQDADRSRTLGYVEQVRREFDDYVAERYRWHLAQRQPRVVKEYEAALQGYVEQVLINDGAAALALSQSLVQELRDRLAAEERRLATWIEGNPQSGVEGSRQRVATVKEEWPAAVKRLGDGFSRWPWKRKGRKAKAGFFKNAWTKLRDTTLEHERLVAGRKAYQQLEKSTRAVEQVLDGMVTSLQQQQAELGQLTKTGLGQAGMSGVLDLAILDDPQLVEAHFGTLLATITQNGADSCADNLTAHQVVSGDDDDPLAAQHTGRVLEAFRQRVQGQQLDGTLRDDVERDALEWGNGLIGTAVSVQTIWDALVAEFRARQLLNVPDKNVQDAETKMEHDRQAATQHGTPPPPGGWNARAMNYYIRSKLDEAVERAQPFWKLDPAQLATHGQPKDEFVVIAADQDAYQATQNDPNLGLQGFLQTAAAQLPGAGAPSWIPGRHSVTIYIRQGIVPLFALDKEELRLMREASKQNSVYAYTDRRFENLVDSEIAAPASANHSDGVELEHSGQLNDMASVPPDKQAAGS